MHALNKCLAIGSALLRAKPDHAKPPNNPTKQPNQSAPNPTGKAGPILFFPLRLPSTAPVLDISSRLPSKCTCLALGNGHSIKIRSTEGWTTTEVEQ